MQEPRRGDPLVADASVLVKWFNREEHRDRALLLREAHIRGRLTIMAPTLAPYEVCNALRYGGVPAEGVKAAHRILRGFHVAFIEPSDEVMSLAVATSFERDLTVYDASYIALAGNLGAPLVTADAKMVKNAPRDVKVMRLSSDAFLDTVS
jgi:predicted nucleic acid-binding protein